MKPKLSRNIFLNANPWGLDHHMKEAILSLKQKKAFNAPKTALIIGGSSGYGLATRIVLALQGTKTISIAFEKPMDDNKTGSAGYWNQLLFLKHFGKDHVNYNVDAFSMKTKQKIVDYLKAQNLSLDLVVYSLASGARPNKDNELIRSSIKPIGTLYEGDHLDLAKGTLSKLSLEPASNQEIEDTVFVMGGSDFKDWMDVLEKEKVLSNHVKALTYSYIGGESTKPIYRDGTLGKAKDDLESKTQEIDASLQSYSGEARVALLKAVVTKASLFIPGIAVYGGLLFDIMMKNNTHETIFEHIHRLYHDMIYGNERVEDEKRRLLMDSFERNDAVQNEINAYSTNENVLNLKGMKAFIDEFYQINGFRLGFDDLDEDIQSFHDQLI